MEFIRIGKITATHGLDGRVNLFHNLGKNKELKNLKFIFIELRKESYIPFFIKSVNLSSENDLLLVVEDVEDMETAKRLSGKDVYLNTEQYEKLKPKDHQINFIGFEVIDQDFGSLGLVENLLEPPGQLLASVLYKEKEIIIPLNDATIKDVDIYSKKLSVTLPEGLIDIYL